MFAKLISISPFMDVNSFLAIFKNPLDILIQKTRGVLIDS